MGINMPPPRPCSTRKPISMLDDCDSAQASEPRVKSPSEPRKTVLAPNRSLNHPASGITAAWARK